MPPSSVAMATITEGTLIPISLIIIVGSSIMGGIIWLTKLHSDVRTLKSSMTDVGGSLKKEVDQSKTDSERLVKVEVQLQNVMMIVNEIKQTLSKVEDRLSK